MQQLYVDRVKTLYATEADKKVDVPRTTKKMIKWSNFYPSIFWVCHIEFHERINTVYRLQIPALVPEIFKFKNG